MNRRIAVVLALTATVAACGRSATPTGPAATPSLVSPAGSWSGSISDPISGNGTVQLSLSEQTPNSLTGPWSATFENGDRFSGPAVAGPFAPSGGYGVILYVQPQPPCEGGPGTAPLSFMLLDVVVTATRLTAVTGRLSCSGMAFGTVNLSKQ